MMVDAQIHIWGANTPERPWPAAGAGGRTSAPQREQPWRADEVLSHMDAAGVDRAVLVPPSWEGERNDLVLDAARRYPTRFAIMGRIGMDADNRDLLSGWRRQPGMLGVRLILSDAAEWLRQGEDHWLWGAAEKAGVPITLVPRQFYPLLENILHRHPALKLCIDHLGCETHKRDDAAFEHVPQLVRLARFPNLAVKATSLPSYSTHAYPFRNTHEPLRRVYDAFGPRRVFWGTDLTRLPCSYGEAISMFTDELPWLPRADLEWVLGRGVCEWFGWT